MKEYDQHSEWVYIIYSKNLGRRDHLKNLFLDGRIEPGVRVWLDSCGSG
jgi:hypothetical protein